MLSEIVAFCVLNPAERSDARLHLWTYVAVTVSSQPSLEPTQGSTVLSSADKYSHPDPHIPKSHAHSPTRNRPRPCPLTQVRDPFFADFLSLDVEGAELQVLESLDFRRSAFGIVLVEADTGNRSKNEGVRRLLVENG